MGVGTVFHYLGSAIIFVAMILTVIVDISAPVVKAINFLEIDTRSYGAQFGALGYCVDGDGCSRARIGYNPADVLERTTNIDFSNIRTDTTSALTRVFILHYVGTGLTLIAFLASLPNRSTFISLLATFITLLAFIVNAVAAVVNWVVFSLVRSEVNNQVRNAAKYGPAIYLSVVAAALTLIATILMFVTCCAGRRSRKRAASRKSLNGY